MKIAINLTLLAFLFLQSCNNAIDEKLLIGSWSGSQWLVNDKPSANDGPGTHFTFDEQGNYSYTYTGTREEGTYKVENDMLFTTPANQQEMMVKISKLTSDSLVFEMNRSGQNETLILLRK